MVFGTDRAGKCDSNVGFLNPARFGRNTEVSKPGMFSFFSSLFFSSLFSRLKLAKIIAHLVGEISQIIQISQKLHF